MSNHAEKHPSETAAAESEELMTVKEMSRFLKVPENTGYKMLLARQIPSFKMGKLRRVRKSDVVSFVNSHRVEALPGR